MLRGKGECILCIDDDNVVLMATTRLLTRLGYKALAFEDPASALAAFEADPGAIDAVVTDSSMPKLSGTELVGKLLSIRPELPVIVTSGRSDTSQTQAFRELGVREFIPKPSPIAELLLALARELRADTRG
jgi:DNA-binding NtrC family response regulator